MHAEEKMSTNTSSLENLWDIIDQKENNVSKEQLIKPTKYSPVFFWPVP
jgi:hypothetical protein